MKRKRLLVVGALCGVLAFSGCGGEQVLNEAAVVQEFEESFKLNPVAESSGRETGSAFSDRPTSSRPASASEPELARSSSGDQDKALREAAEPLQVLARDVVTMVHAGNYGEAVVHLDQLMGAPDLTREQRRAARRTMIQVQQKLVRDPSLSDDEKRRALETLSN